MLEQYDAAFPIDRSQHNDLGVAATLLSLCAYPERRNLRREGAAHRFVTAQLSWIARRARALKKIDRLPFWCLERQQEINTIRSAFRRLEYFRSCHLTMFELLTRNIHTSTASQQRCGIVMNWSAGFERCEIAISNDDQALERSLKLLPTSIEGAIRKHSIAFWQHNPSPDFVKDIRRRYIYKYLSICHIYAVLHGECLNQAEEAIRRKWSPFAMLISNPDWAVDAVSKIKSIESLPLSYAAMIGLDDFSARNVLHVIETPTSHP